MLILLIQCTPDYTPVGQLEGRTWSHDYFDLAWTIPPGWHIHDPSQLTAAQMRGIYPFRSARKPRPDILLVLSDQPEFSLLQPRLVLTAHPNDEGFEDGLTFLIDRLGEAEPGQLLPPVDWNGHVFARQEHRYLGVTSVHHAAPRHAHILCLTLAWVLAEDRVRLQTLLEKAGMVGPVSVSLSNLPADRSLAAQS